MPILIGTTKESVEFLVSSSGEIASASFETFKYKGKEYYYSNSDSIDKYTDRLNTEEDAPYYFCSVQTKVCKDVLKDVLRQKELSEKGSVWFFVSNYWKHVIIGAAVIAVAAVILKIILKRRSDCEA